MKDPSDSVICVVDRGTFWPIAKALAKDCKKVFYSNPAAAYCEDLMTASKGSGHPDIELVEDYWRIKNDIDVWVFPDAADVGPQIELRSQGRAVWGSMAASDLERFRGRWLDLCDDLKLPMPTTNRVRGVSALRDFFKKHAYEEWYVKCSRWRTDMETWKACEPAQIEAKIAWLCLRWGPLAEQIMFYVQKKIDTEIEDGVDTYNINGQWPDKVIYGLEKKGESYLATWKEPSELDVQWETMSAITDTLAEHGYANFISSELRRTKTKSFWLDPCMRVPSPAGEEQFLMYKNTSRIICAGANGELIQPDMAAKFCGEAVIEYNGDRDAWKAFEVPDSVKDFTALYACVYSDGAYWFPPTQDPIAIGCAVGVGSTPQEVIDQLKYIAEELKNAPVTLHIDAMADLIKEVDAVEKSGTEFSKEMPPLEAVLED